MSTIPWEANINFSSALLLHSCLTIILKELFNMITIIHRLYFVLGARHAKASTLQQIRGTVILDSYTSIFSLDEDGAQAELYFTNTGLFLLMFSLSASVAMNLLLQDVVLNMIVVGTFGSCFLASLFVGKGRITLPIMALRRAGRFIWSDTPFVNFFTLIYIATVLRGQSILRLQDYVTFRSVAVLELVFMKAKLAASSPEDQEKMMRDLIKSEWKFISTHTQEISVSHLPYIHRHAIVAFQTYQRLSVMLFKTSPGYDGGCLQGSNGPCRCRIPAPGRSLRDEGNCLRVCRVNYNTIILSDCFNLQETDSLWSQFLKHTHGMLLRRIGRVRVVFAIQSQKTTSELCFHSNINMVTGVPKVWLDNFIEGEAVGECVIGGRQWT
ncbi:hypothetical protein BDW59DRAFT_148127 [Aspergillus cavernicola]|uniref:ABC transmembrane type-1 domain-containing protein n=1 Tax=Aspergillus cavernicola TaxID=176166 RepID=A0ABR4IA85_9EURO